MFKYAAIRSTILFTEPEEVKQFDLGSLSTERSEVSQWVVYLHKKPQSVAEYSVGVMRKMMVSAVMQKHRCRLRYKHSCCSSNEKE